MLPLDYPSEGKGKPGRVTHSTDWVNASRLGFAKKAGVKEFFKRLYRGSAIQGPSELITIFGYAVQFGATAFGRAESPSPTVVGVVSSLVKRLNSAKAEPKATRFRLLPQGNPENG